MSAVDDEKNLKDSRYVRWQAISMAQFSVTIALLSGVSTLALGAGLGLLQSDNFVRPASYQLAFVIAMLLFVLTVMLCLVATISRTLDFRLTARKVRGRTDLILFGMGDRQFGRVSWGSFWVATLAFFLGAMLFLGSIGFFLAQKLLCGV